MARGIKESVLIGGGAVLVLLTVLLLIALRGSEEPEEPETTRQAPAVKPASTPIQAVKIPGSEPEPEVTPARPTPPPPPKPAGAPVLVNPGLVTPIRLEPVPPSREPRVEEVRVFPSEQAGQATAPMAEPPELRNEPDPRRREMLRRMHKLAEAKMRHDVFSRRARMLEQSLAEGAASGTWTEQKRKQARDDLRQLEESIRSSAARVEELKARVDEEIRE